MKLFPQKMLYIAILLVISMLQPCIAQNQSKVTFDLYNRRIENNVYKAELWCIIAPGQIWNVSSSTIAIQYNANALDPSTYSNQTLDDLEAGLTTSCYSVMQEDRGNSIVTVEIDWSCLNIPRYASYSGPVGIGDSYHIGTIRWDIRNGGRSLTDNLGFSNTLTDVSHYDRNSNTIINLTRQDNNNPPCNTCYKLELRVRQTIDPSTIECENGFYQNTDCFESQEISREDPIGENCERWQTANMYGRKAAYYQYAFNNAPNDAPIGNDKVRFFTDFEQESLMDDGRCRWEKQSSSTYFGWRTTTNGGLFRWSDIPTDFGTAAGQAYAVTYNAFENTTPYKDKYVPASQCSNGPNGRSEIIFNKTPALWVRNPQYRWTTRYGDCSGGPDCLDFYTIALHELGHYVGLGHEDYNHQTVMFAGRFVGRKTNMTLCDSDKMRRLYSPSWMLGSPPDNSSNIACFLVGVQETHIEDKTEFSIFPNPVANELQLEIAENIHMKSIKILDVLGREVYGAIPQQKLLTIDVNQLPNGTYYIQLQKNSLEVITRVFTISK